MAWNTNFIVKLSARSFKTAEIVPQNSTDYNNPHNLVEQLTTLISRRTLILSICIICKCYSQGLQFIVEDFSSTCTFKGLKFYTLNSTCILVISERTLNESLQDERDAALTIYQKLSNIRQRNSNKGAQTVQLVMVC